MIRILESHKNRFIVRILALIVTLTSCDIKENNDAISENFSVIYHKDDANAQYYPISFKQTADGGFIILGVSGTEDVYILKTDEYGKIEWEIENEENYIRPVSSLLSINGEYGFFCMNETNLSSTVLSIDTSVKTLNVVLNSRTDLYPLNASQTSDGGVLYQHYDRENKEVAIKKYSAAMTEEWSEGARVGFEKEFEQEILKNIAEPDPWAPLYSGESADGYFVNSFLEYNYRTVFLSLSGNTTGEINGQQTDASCSGMLHLEGNTYALSHFDADGQTYIVPRISIDNTTSLSVTNLGGLVFHEIVERAEVRIRKVAINGLYYTVFACDTKDGQIELLFFDRDGNYVSSKYVGHNHYYHISDLIQTNDEGLALLAQTAVAGRFKRITLINMSKGELEDLIR